MSCTYKKINVDYSTFRTSLVEMKGVEPLSVEDNSIVSTSLVIFIFSHKKSKYNQKFLC